MNNNKSIVSASRTFSIETDKTGAKITPTPMYPATISCNISVDMLAYDKLCDARNGWGIRTEEDALMYRKQIIDAACEEFKKSLKKTMDEYIGIANASFPIFEFGNLFLRTRGGGATSYGLTVTVHGVHAGVCYVSGTRLMLGILSPRTFERYEGIDELKDECFTLTEEYLARCIPGGYRSLFKHTAPNQKYLRKSLQKAIKEIAWNIASDMGYKYTGYERGDYDYSSKDVMSDGFAYLITKLLYNYIEENLPKDDHSSLWVLNANRGLTTINEILGSYALLDPVRFNEVVMAGDISDKTPIKLYDSAYDAANQSAISMKACVKQYSIKLHREETKFGLDDNCKRRAVITIFHTDKDESDGVDYTESLSDIIGYLVFQESILTSSSDTRWNIRLDIPVTTNTFILGYIDRYKRYYPEYGITGQARILENARDIVQEIERLAAKFLADTYSLDGYAIYKELYAADVINSAVEDVMGTIAIDKAK